MSIAEAGVSGVENHPSRADARAGHLEHVVQFYREDRSLLDTVSLSLQAALAKGGAAVVVATKAHRVAIAGELRRAGVDLERAADQGRYFSIDASKLLSQFMVGQKPDAARFTQRMGEIIDRAHQAATGGQGEIAIFGEMVSVLWSEGKREAAIELERLWNQLAKRYSFSLHCAYPFASVSGPEDREWFTAIVAQHSGAIGVPSYQALVSGGDGGHSMARSEQKIAAAETQRAHLEIEQQLALLVGALRDYAIFLLGPDGRIKTWNSGAQKINGYEASEIIGRHFSCFYPEEDVRAGLPELHLEAAAREGRVEYEGWRLRKNGSRLWAYVTLTALRDSSGKLLGFGKVTRDFTERMRTAQALGESQAKLKASEQSLRELSFRLLRAQDEERRRIGRDLHDSIGQYLSVLRIRLDAMAQANPGHDVIASELQKCAELTDEAVRELRTVSYLLHPPMLEDLGLRVAIAWYVEGFTKRSGVQTSFDASSDFGRLSPDAELSLFRVVQESLTNVHRHSGSKTAKVTLSSEGGAVRLEIIDEGSGLGEQLLKTSGQGGAGDHGVGIRGMSERLRQLGGRLELSSSPKGTTVTAIVPLS